MVSLPGKEVERQVFSCDYNGWTDVPEEEREGIEVFEASRQLPALLIPRIARPPQPLVWVPRRRAA